MTAGEAIVAALEANGIRTVFGLPGVQMYPLFDALYQRKQAIRTVSSRHEQGCAYMAYGFAASTGQPGVFTVVPGPGVLNAGAALNTAWAANAPVLCITGEIPTPFAGKHRGQLHELPDQLATLRSIVKWAETIDRPADAPAVINEAFRQMLSGRRGPVAVQIPWDTLAASEDVADPRPATIDAPSAPSDDSIEQAAKLLASAKRPLIMVGSGAQHAAAEVLALAEALNAPVSSFRGGRGIVAEDHELGLSNYAASRLFPASRRSARHRLAPRTSLPALDQESHGIPRCRRRSAAAHPHRHRSARNAAPPAARRRRGRFGAQPQSIACEG